ncbi:MAG TPA: hypothetical protein VFS26_10165 [Solirubrobacterales bacterium]|nr:hypothetical protein [Solirubrobacterales bacterium]
MRRSRTRSSRLLEAGGAAQEDVHREPERGQPDDADEELRGGVEVGREGSLVHHPRRAPARQQPGEGTWGSWNIGVCTTPRSVITRKSIRKVAGELVEDGARERPDLAVEWSSE